ncbi:7655_t:CDS:2 [Funneliformis caledonium]|uniref:7655_t:CDS:1 n=1 Tax=Funneliformis caledonium TaxID=1117310 RepID=A0A9N9I5J3_9GLOM|nr:7655_t:CDS:2 [Funneliformis caledonium]
MYTNPIEAFAINILKNTNVLPENTVFPEVDPYSLCGEGLYLPQKFLPFKEFTLASCGHIYHQKYLEKHLATSSIEVVSITPGNPKNLDDLISKDTSGQI